MGGAEQERVVGGDPFEVSAALQFVAPEAPIANRALPHDVTGAIDFDNALALHGVDESNARRAKLR